jgi:tetratricopeptide (TPR) repeat protein
MTVTTLSLCLMVKNEIDHLAACVDSARDAVDQVVIVDTGSTDGTAELAEQLADVYVEHEFADDFSAVRNLACRHAGGDWILFLDADERLTDRSRLELRALPLDADDGVDGYTLLRYNIFRDGGFYTTRELKLHRRSLDITYERSINESVYASIARRGGTVVDAPIFFNHFGHCRSLASRLVKAEQYLTLFRAELLRNPDDPMFHSFAGLVLRTLGRFDEALGHVERALELAPQVPLIRLFAGHVLRSAGDDEAALAMYEEGLALAPSNASLANMAGVMHLCRGDVEPAAELFRQALIADPTAHHVLVNQGLLAQSCERWEEAAELFRRALDVNPAFGHYDWSSHVEADFFRPTYFETPYGFHGVAYHLALCDARSGAITPPPSRT